MADRLIAIGQLRWRVTLVTRAQTAPAEDTGITETWTDLQVVWADVQPMGAMTYWAAQQTDTPVTHRIRMRWVSALDNTQAVIRSTTLRDGSIRTEIFRVRRIKEIDGRKRYVEIEAELEHLECP